VLAIAAMTTRLPFPYGAPSEDPVIQLCADWWRRHTAWEERHNTEYSPLDEKWIEASDPAEKARWGAAADAVMDSLSDELDGIVMLEIKISDIRSASFAGMVAKLRIAAYHAEDGADVERISLFVDSALQDAEKIGTA
jgi:hypothetical protein